MIIEIQEHQTEHGLRFSTEEVDFLLRYHQKHLQLIPQTQNLWSVKAGAYVGRIRLGQKQISIRPKVPNANLFYMLSCCLRLANFYAPTHFSENPNESLPELYVRLLVQQIGVLFKMGIHQTYHVQEAVTSTVRGKIMIAKSPHQAHRLSCSFDERSPDNLENQLIKTPYYMY